MKMTIQAQVFVIVAVTAALALLMWRMGAAARKANPYEKPKGLAFLALTLVETVDGLVAGVTTHPGYRKWMGPYIGAIASYILVSNLLGLLSIDSPTNNYSVTLSLTLVTWVLIQATNIRTNGVKGYFKSFFEPYPPFVIMNFFGTIAPLISMSLRLFGNILSGGFILYLFYTFTAYLSSLIPAIGSFNFLGVLIAPFLHAYFDIFAGCIQMYIFISLSMVFIGNNTPANESSPIEE